MIKIHKSPTADTRTCDVRFVTKGILIDSSNQHIKDVQKGLGFFTKMIIQAGISHDYTKLSHMDQFFADFQTKFESHGWWDMHKTRERHHLTDPAGVCVDVNLVDVLEHVVDCVMAGMARTGSVYMIDLPNEVLQKAFQNTVKLLQENVKVVE